MTPLSLDDARRLVQGYVERYNNARLNSAIGYVTPKDMRSEKRCGCNVTCRGILAVYFESRDIYAFSVSPELPA